MMNNYYVIIFVFSILIASFSQIMLKIGSTKKNIFLNKYSIFGYFLMFVSTLFTLFAYKGVKLATGAMLQSLSFIFVSVFSFFMLKEKINKNKLVSIFLIVLGMIIYAIKW